MLSWASVKTFMLISRRLICAKQGISCAYQGASWLRLFHKSRLPEEMRICYVAEVKLVTMSQVYGDKCRGDYLPAFCTTL